MTTPPGIGDALPDIALTHADGRSVRIGDCAGRRVVLFFFPKAMTPGCTRQVQDFARHAPAFAAAGVAVLGISKDPPERLQAFAHKHGPDLDLASDCAEPALSDALGIWTEKQLYGRRFMGMVRTTYLIGADGRIERIWPRVRVDGHADAVLAVATDADSRQ